MPKRVLCKFSAHGACLKGEHCEFSHDWKDPPFNICTFYQSGVCAYGSRCRYEHIDVAETSAHGAVAEENHPNARGEECPICGKQCLQPREREEHSNVCEGRRKHMEALRTSQEIECCVCLDRVLSKPTRAGRKFGILSECDHPFCISCIRNWRSSSPASGLNINSALRACPVCRRRSYFVIPSATWFSSKEEKHEIINNYKKKLSTIDCKYFDFGKRTCPFGAGCFYKHAYQDGRQEKAFEHS
ncbi:E3 ubiquitin-protein ligase makorin-like isoform X2 [Andrographis paniculata]|uniref:E3 ubiquitin-protein ligase makorin-like isoform X2 n=1 Tax=Andrographis paniculata TaxID=175694 RepID=UPI0021E93F50|nr:E3 ubiquitin-protein ligase makorin-like isoform X2 [Andrographis paniculata]